MHQDESKNLVEVIEPNLMRLSPGAGSYETGQAVLEKHIYDQGRGSKGGSFTRSSRGLAAPALAGGKDSRSSLAGRQRFQKATRVRGVPSNIFICEQDVQD